ncbi:MULTISPECIES: PAS domain-containing protein [unclassified Nitrospina]|uniref:PAS domain-containing protein n=1 Tax=unclassified Nitrospina TaxID=2638683 RepID=UPI003F9510F6
MASLPNDPAATPPPNEITEEYRILHRVAQVLEENRDLKSLLNQVLQEITGFKKLKVKPKSGIFLADEAKRVLRLFTTQGDFSEEFLQKEKEVPFGNCLCGRAAESKELLMSESCFTDPRHERTYTDMTAHGHYIIPLKTSEGRLVGIMFLYTEIQPRWYQHSQAVLLSIGGLVAHTIERKKIENELITLKEKLEVQIEERTHDLMESRRILNTLISNLPGMVYRSLNDSQRTMLFISDGCSAITGENASEFLGKKIKFQQLIHPVDQLRVYQTIKKAIKDKEPYTLIYRINTLSGNEKIVRDQGRGIYSEAGELTALEGFITDETKRYMMEEELNLSHQRLRNLGNKLQSIREEEKTRISREVHDELGQSLTALKMNVLYLKENNPLDRMEILERYEAMTNMIDSTIRSVQKIATELRPPILDAFGLSEAIAWQADEYSSKFGLHFDLKGMDREIKIEESLQTTLFRIFQETLTNIVRHANASRVQVALKGEGNNLVLEVADNGKGIKKESLENINSLGLVGIQERVHLWNGNVIFKGKPGKGTKVRVEIPVNN